MQPNSLGDFIAGAFGPLALFWLVCGYFQQSIQLKLNTKALTLQTEALNLQLAELRASVFHQREMSAAATEQARLASDQAQVAAQLDAQVRESAEPKLKIVKLQQWPDTDPSKPRHVSFGVLNQGGNAKVIEVDWQRASMRAKGTLGAGETLEISLRGPEKQHKAVREVPFKIRDDLGRESSWLIQLKPVEGIFEVEIARTQ
ncbi:hypothetical protein JY458_05885 [Stenotrophomonas maltophilia]|nr:hypothetical protein [Stenotrophomonas maltophilia]